VWKTSAIFKILCEHRGDTDEISEVLGDSLVCLRSREHEFGLASVVLTCSL